MITNITGRHFDVTDAIHSYVEKKIAKLSNHYGRIAEIDVILEEEKLTQKVEIIVKTDHAQQFVVTETGEDMYGSIDLGVDKMERQLRRYKEKQHKHKGRSGTAQATNDYLDSLETPDA